MDAPKINTRLKANSVPSIIRSRFPNKRHLLSWLPCLPCKDEGGSEQPIVFALPPIHIPSHVDVKHTPLPPPPLLLVLQNYFETVWHVPLMWMCILKI